MKRLVVNTANDKLMIVLQNEGQVFCKTNESKMRHNEAMLPLIDELLKENEVDINEIKEFGVVIGPGSFTGIRVGISTIKAFKDSVDGAKAKGINNLDYLFALAQNKDKDIETVAICGSKNSYFVAKKIHNVLYKYERNLTTEELSEIAENKSVGMFLNDDDINCVQLLDDPNVLLSCLDVSDDNELIPVYYQLSQAENEKLKKGNVVVESASVEDLEKISLIEKDSINVNTLSKDEICRCLTNENYKTFKVVFNEELVGFVILQVTDEVNIDSIAVAKNYRNLGLATKLIEKSIDFAKMNNIKSISLEVSYNNINAYLLYKKLGFEVRRVRKNYYADKSDCLEMVKSV